MASIKTYKRQSGGITYRVVWRAGGGRDGAWEAELFDGSTAAERFRDLVNGHGQQWPPGWVKGEGFVEQEPEESACPAEEMFPAFAPVRPPPGLGGRRGGGSRGMGHESCGHGADL